MSLLRVEYDKQAIFIDKSRIGPSDMLNPIVIHHPIGDVVVPRQQEKRNCQRRFMLPKLRPFCVKLFSVGRYSLYQVANHNRKVRLQRINFADCAVKHVPLIEPSTCFITNNCEAEFVRIV